MAHVRGYRVEWSPFVSEAAEGIAFFEQTIGFSDVWGRQISVSPHTENTIGFADLIGAFRELAPVGISSQIGFSDEIGEVGFKFDYHWFGSLREGYDDNDGQYDSPTLSDYWVSFDGNDALYWDQDLDTSDFELHAIFRIDETEFVDVSANHGVVFKSGSNTDGVSLSYYKKGSNQPFLVYTGVVSTVKTFIEVNLKNISFLTGVWYEVFAKASKLVVREYGNDSNSVTVEGTCNVGYTDYYQSVGCSVGPSPVVTSSGGYIKGSVRDLDFYRAGKLDMPADINLYPFPFYIKYGNNYEGNGGVIGSGGSPTIEDDWITFDGSTAQYYDASSPIQDITDIDIYMVFRLEENHLDVLDGFYTLWSIGSSTDGFELGIFDRYLGFVSRNNTVLQENIVSIYNLELDVWYEVFISTSKITVREQATPTNGFTQYATVDVNANYTSGYHAIAAGVGDYIWKGGSGSWTDYTQMSVKEIALYQKGSLTFPSDLSAPVVGPIYRWNWGSDVGNYYGWSYTGSLTINTDNVETDGNDSFYDGSGGYYPRPTTGWGIVVEFEAGSLSGPQVIWKTGDEVNGAAIGFDASGNFGFFGRSSGSLTSITISASTYLSTNTKYFIYANETDIKILDASLSLVTEANGTVIASDSSGSSDNQGIMGAVYGSPISGNSNTWNDYFTGKLYSHEIWEQDDLSFPETNWYHAETNEIGFSDTIDGELVTAIVGISSTIGFNDENSADNVANTRDTQSELGLDDTIIGTQVATQKLVASTLGFNDDMDADHIDENTGYHEAILGFDDEVGGYNVVTRKEAASTFGLNDEIGGRRQLSNVGQQSIFGLNDEIDAYNSVIHKESASTFGLSDEVGGDNIVSRKESASELGLNDSIGVNLEQEKGNSHQIGFDDTVGEISIKNVGFSSTFGLNSYVAGGNPLSPDNEAEIGFSDEIGVLYYPVKGFSSTIGFNENLGTVRDYEVGITSILGLSDSPFAENSGNLIPYHPANMRYKFYLTLTGANDSLDDYEIKQLKTIQFRMKSGEESSYLGISAIYSEEKETEIDSRSNGTLILEMASVYEGVEVLRETLMEVDFSDVRYDIGSNNRSITINGYRALTYNHDISYLVDATFKRINQDGRISYRFSRPDFYLRPGWEAVYGLEKFTVDEVAFYVGENTFEMDVYFEPDTLSGENQNDIYQRRWYPTYRERKLFVTLTGSEDAVEDYSFTNVFHLEIRKKAGAASYASVTLLYSKETQDAIDARPNGDIVIYVQDGIDASPEELLTVNFNNLSSQLLQKSRTITIAGFKQVPYATGVTYTPVNIISERVEENGDYYVRSATPNINIKPGCTITYGGKTFIAGKVSFNFASQNEWMEISNTANINVDRYTDEILGITDEIISNTFYRDNNGESTFGINDSPHVSINDVENAYHDTSNIGFQSLIGYELNPEE